MILVKIGEEEFNLPEGWHEVNLEKFSKIIELNDRIDEWKSTVEFSIEVFSVLIETSKEKIMNLTRASFNQLTEETKWLWQEVPSEAKEEFIFLGSKWRLLKDLNKLTMGESISLELKIAESNNATILPNIIPILLRRIKEIKVSGGIETALIPFESDRYEEIREAAMKEIKITEIISFRDFFLDGGKASSGTTKDTLVKAERKKKKRVMS